MNIEQLKELATNRLNFIRAQAGQAHNEGRIEDYFRLQDDEKEVLLVLEKLNS
jgi:hypothetical protein